MTGGKQKNRAHVLYNYGKQGVCVYVGKNKLFFLENLTKKNEPIHTQGMHSKSIINMYVIDEGEKGRRKQKIKLTRCGVTALVVVNVN